MTPVPARIASVVAVTLLAATMPTAAEARPGGQGYRYVTAQSLYGHGTLTAPIRPSRLGYEVQLPGGVWIPCAASCADTLRREKLDFWETQSEHIRAR